ncbi:glycosyltransferase [Fodinibius sp.]|uniref:glycosyltransferase n=1 Tax=Fodinibius sp. TaxID=1872440 RepID=UPI00356A965B
MHNPPKVTFIICTYNRAGYLDDTLRSLKRQQHLPELPVEVLVVDNNATDATPQIVKRHQKSYPKDHNPIRYIKESNQGLSHARNRGIAEAAASCVVFLDDDIRATEMLMPAWLNFFETHPEAVAGGGKIHVQFDDPRPNWMSHFLLPLLGHHDLGNAPRTYPGNKYPFGGNMGFRKNIFDRLGTFDTNLGRMGNQLKASEEKEFFERLKAEGVAIQYLPQAMLYHRVDKGRLTEAYIRRQAVGLGQSIALQVEHKPVSRIRKWILELGKCMATFALFLPYVISLQPAKGVMLIKFRKWIIDGYFTKRPE